LLEAYLVHHILHSFPTRRSSDLQLEHSQRTEGVLLPSGVYLRDQRPMSPSALSACLHGMVTSDWYAALNARVFFWVNIDRLNRQDRKSTRLNSSHEWISYAVFCL